MVQAPAAWATRSAIDMGKSTHIIQFLVAGVVVVLLGGLLGWYVFVNKNIEETKISDTARGFGTTPSFGNTIGSTYQNIVESLMGGATSTPAHSGQGAPRLWHVSRNPTAGMGFASSSAQLFFAERSTGNILAADPSTSIIARLTNTLFPKIYDATFAGDGNVILRALSEEGLITSFAGTLASTSPSLDPNAAPRELKGHYLPQNVTSVGVRGKQLLYLVEDPDGGSALVQSDWKTSAPKKMFSSTLSDWSIDWLPDNRIILAQKPSDDIAGYAYELKGGSLVPLMENMSGLSIRGRANAEAILYSTSGNGSVTLFGRPRSNSSTAVLPIQTVADKCVWAPGAALVAYCAVPQSISSSAYLFNSYRGALHTSDSWWRIDVATGAAEMFYTPDSSLSLDIERPLIDTRGEYISFIDATDRSLWMLRIAP